MRDIKFRAYDKKENEMFYSSMYQDKTSMAYGLSNFLSECTDIEDTLMQYTGLKDKDGVEIYEDDIVKFIPSGEYGLVTTFGSSQNLGIEWENSRTAFFTPMFYLGCETELEIIGNIYESPELLDK